MYITLESDYAVRILIFLCQQEKRTDASSISKHTGVTQRFTLKILRKLVIGGILKSYKGMHGGYILAKTPMDISLLEVVEIIEGHYYFSRCLSKNHKNDSWCQGSGCKVKKVYADISNQVRSKLESVSFGKLL